MAESIPPRRRWLQFGIAAIVIAPILMGAGFGPLLDGADDADRGAIGQIFVFASAASFLVGVAGIAFGIRHGG